METVACGTPGRVAVWLEVELGLAAVDRLGARGYRPE